MVIRTDIRGFSLVELLVVMGITVFVLAATSKILTTMITTMKQQSKIAETSIESVVGLEILRRDIQSAGFGLATGISNGISTYRVVDWTDLADYTEASETNPSRFNDAGGGATYRASDDPAPPRAFVSAAPAWTVNGSDYLAIKGANLGDTPASGKFHTLEFGGAVNTWSPQRSNPILDANLLNTDYVMVISIRDTERIGLARDSTDDSLYYTQFNAIDLANFEPPNNREVRIVYGLDSDDTPVAPFNRADYYISDVNVPEQCAPGTGVLVKASMRHADGKLGNERPLLDCVADLQVSYGLDTDENGTIDFPTDDMLGFSALKIYEELKQVRVFVLLHEGRSDPRRKFYPDPADPSDKTIYVGEPGLGRDFDLSALDATWNNYKWRVLKLVETPAAMR